MATTNNTTTSFMAGIQNTKARPVIRRNKETTVNKNPETASFLPGQSQLEPKSAPQAVKTEQETTERPVVAKGISDLVSRAMRVRQVAAETERMLDKAVRLSGTSDFADVFHNQEHKVAVLGQNAPLAIEKEKVAAYIRVSTDSSDQENSYEMQERYFNHLLASNPLWVSVGIYSDYGISGTSKAGRTGFKRLLRHCEEGRINRIVCKSISRFARNTADFLSALQVLKDNDVTIYFEKEGLDTANPMNEFVVTTLGAVAQQESYSISENQKLSYDKRIQNGEVKNVEIYGYRFNGKWITMVTGYRYKDVDIIEDEAEVVRRIFNEVADGKSYLEIARGLNRDGIPAPKRKTGKKKGELYEDIDQGWTGSRISHIVASERYVGDVRLQKTYTKDCLTHEICKNNGEVPQYVISDHHPAIIDRELYEKVQNIVASNKGGIHVKSNRILSKMLICPNCGRFYNVRNSSNNPIWFCPSSALNNGKRICFATRLYEKQVERMLHKAILERFGENREAVDDSNAPLADVLDAYAAAEGGFVEKMIARLETVQSHDTTERDRALLGRRVAAIQLGNERMEQRIGLLTSQKETLLARRDLLNDESVTDEMLTEKDAEIEAEKAKLEEGRKDGQSYIERFETLAAYWEELEDSYDERENAIEWMKGLTTQDEPQRAFLDGLLSHLKAFVFSITVYSPLKFSIHWFDNSRSDVTMGSNVDEGINLD